MKTYFYYSFLILLLSTGTVSNAQSPNWLWANSFGSTDDDIAYSIAVDDSGNVYSIGYFKGTVDFDPDTTIFNLTSAGNEDIFVSKVNSLGNFVWAKAFGSAGFDLGSSIALDAAGNICVTGFYNDSVDFDPGAGIFNLTSQGLNDIFVCKLNGSGDLIWAKSMGGTSSDAGQSLVLDKSDNVYLTGSFNGTADFDPDTSATYDLISMGNLEIFISKLDSAGNFAWAKSIGGIEDDQPYSIATDTFGFVYVTGYFEKTVDFDPGIDTFNLTSAGNLPDAFICKLDSFGVFDWAKAFKGTGDNDGLSVKVDNWGNVYSVGYFNNTVDFDPDSTVTYNMTSAGAYDIYISKLDSSGSFIWAKSMGGTDDDQGFSIALDDSGNVYTTGIFRSTADFDPDTGTFNFTAAGGFDMFISVLDSSGNFVWAKSAGGNNRDQGNCIVTDNSYNVYVAGYYYSTTLSFGTTTLTNSNSIGLTSDMFVIKLGDITTGILSIENESGFSVYPNPANKYFTVSYDLPEHANGVIQVFDLNGKIIYSDVISESGRSDVNTVGFSAGVHFVRLMTRDFINTLKIIIEN